MHLNAQMHNRSGDKVVPRKPPTGSACCDHNYVLFRWWMRMLCCTVYVPVLSCTVYVPMLSCIVVCAEARTISEGSWGDATPQGRLIKTFVVRSQSFIFEIYPCKNQQKTHIVFIKPNVLSVKVSLERAHVQKYTSF